MTILLAVEMADVHTHRAHALDLQSRLARQLRAVDAPESQPPRELATAQKLAIGIDERAVCQTDRRREAPPPD